MKVSLVAAMGKNRVIGLNGDMPWRGRLPADVEHFVNTTRGKAVIMGRKTWESLPKGSKPLAGRKNIVLTRDTEFKAPGCIVVHSAEEALLEAEGKREAVVIGGSEIYELFLPLADTMYLTLIDREFVGDAFFPEVDCSEWKLISKVEIFKGLSNHYSGKIVTLNRI